MDGGWKRAEKASKTSIKEGWMQKKGTQSQSFVLCLSPCCLFSCPFSLLSHASAPHLKPLFSFILGCCLLLCRGYERSSKTTLFRPHDGQLNIQ